MTAEITAIYKFGNRRSVHLSCGHRLTLTPADLKTRQLYIGRVVQCEECKEEKTT